MPLDARERLIVALDLPSVSAAEAMTKRLLAHQPSTRIDGSFPRLVRIADVPEICLPGIQH